MKVVIINTWDRVGGAAVAANRLMQTLSKANIEAKMLVRDKQTPDEKVCAVTTNWFDRKINTIRFIWERFIIFLNNKFDRSTVFQVSIANTGIDISNHPLIKEADIIHLHWINQGYLSIKDIGRLTDLGKPIVWTMHDMWPCTGICHHARDCENYKTGCGKCFFLKSDKRNDLSAKIFLDKQKLLSNSDITFVGCSRWLADKAKASLLTCTNPVESIPNPLDTTKYKPKDKTEARNKFNLPQNKYLVLFGAVNLTDERKGFRYFIKSLEQIRNNNTELSEMIEVVTFGQTKHDISKLFPFPTHTLGYFNNQEDIITLYNAVDVFVTPSLEENLPNTIMESMACGTPCIGFEVGGIPEMIDHKQNGYVSRYKDIEDMAEGIEWVLNNAVTQNLAHKCIEKVQKCYSEQIVAAKYISLYKKLLN